MKEELELSRRENTLTIRYLAQGLINDSLYPDQKGIRELFSKAIDGNNNKLGLGDSKFEYSFLFHLEDFMSEKEKDKSEIDLLLSQEDKLFIVEIKTFTDANSLGVKREIVRNYLRLKSIIANGTYFKKTEKIISILLYSNNFQQKLRKHQPSDYFNNKFLWKKGSKQKDEIEQEDWEKGNYKIDKALIENYASFDKVKREISESLYFLTWNDVLDSYFELNKANNRLDSLINELKNKKDSFSKAFDHPVKLIG